MIVLRGLFLSISLLSLFLFGCAAKVDIDGERVTYEQLTEKIAELNEQIEELEETKENYETIIAGVEEELDEIQENIDELSDEYDAHKEEFERLLSLVEEEETLIKNIETLNKTLDEKEAKKKALKGDIKGKEKELSKIENVVSKTKEDPIELIAGQYIVGTDIPEGRYQATNIGDGSNFVVHSSGGSLKVNTILGDSIVGSGDYVFFADDGDVIETRGRAKLIPVE